MTPKKFKPEDYFDSSLCEALDRMARDAGIIDVCGNPTLPGTAWKHHLPYDDEPWLFINSHRLNPEVLAERDNQSSPLGLFLRSRPASARQKEIDAEQDGRLRAMKAFEDLVTPLFSALAKGEIIALGYRLEDEASSIAERIPAKWWSRQWILTRDGSAVVLEFYDSGRINDFSKEHIARFIMVEVVAPLPSELPAAAEAAEPIAALTTGSAESAGGKEQYAEDGGHVLTIRRLILEGIRSNVGAAVTYMQREMGIKIGGASEKAKKQRLKGKYDLEFPAPATAGATRPLSKTQKRLARARTG